MCEPRLGTSTAVSGHRHFWHAHHLREQCGRTIDKGVQERAPGASVSLLAQTGQSEEIHSPEEWAGGLAGPNLVLARFCDIEAAGERR